MNIKFAKLKECAKIPSKRDEDAGMDVYACFDEQYEIIWPHTTKIIKTGIASVIENGYFVKLSERGSTGTKGMAQRCGVIDSGYRGEWGVPITNVNSVPLVICKNDNETINSVKTTFNNEAIIYPYEKAICQAIVLPSPKVDVEEINKEELDNYISERGAGALGSSGK